METRPPATSARWIEPVLALLVVAGVQSVLFGQISSYALMGWDTLPQIASARIVSLGDFLGTFTEETADGVYPFSFYRPVFNLSLAADHALYGLRPLGYHATDALLGGACALALFGLARQLLGRTGRVGAWIALVTFLILPVHVDVVALVSRRMDVLCGLFVALAVTAQLRRLDSTSWLGGAWPAVFTMCAVGAKETGLVAAPLVGLAVLGVSRSASPRARLERAARAAWPHFAAVALVFVARLAALGELGGHGTTSLSGGLTRLPWAMGLLLVRISSLTTTDAVPLDAPWLAWLGGMALAGVAGVWLVFLVDPRAQASDEADGDEGGQPAGRRALVAALVGLGWLVCIAFVYAVNGFIHPWYLVMPGQALALLFGACAADLLRGASTRSRVLTAAGTAGLVLAVTAQARWSPLFHTYDHWYRGSAAMERYLDGLTRRIDSAQEGDVIFAMPPPVSLPADPNPFGSTRATVLHVYSLPSWARLRFPERRIEFRHPRLGDASDDPMPDAVVVRVRGGRRAPGARQGDEPGGAGR